MNSIKTMVAMLTPWPFLVGAAYMHAYPLWSIPGAGSRSFYFEIVHPIGILLSILGFLCLFSIVLKIANASKKIIAVFFVVLLVIEIFHAFFSYSIFVVQNVLSDLMVIVVFFGARYELRQRN